MNLQTGGEREIALPRDAGVPRRVGWSRPGRRWRSPRGAASTGPAPAADAKAIAVAAAERPGAESALAVLLGDPVFARVIPCAEPGALCVVADTGAPGVLAEHARDAARWGADSVGVPRRERDRGPAARRGPRPENRVVGASRRPRELTAFGGRRDRPASPAAIASHAASSAIVTGGASGVHSRAPTRSAANATSASQTSVQSSAGPLPHDAVVPAGRHDGVQRRRGTRARTPGSARRDAARPGAGAACASARRRSPRSRSAAGRSTAAGPAPPVVVRLLHEGRSPPLRLAEHLVQQMLLAAEMTVDRAFGHACPGGDGRGGGGTESDGGVELECCSQQPLAGGLTVAACRLW